MSANLKQRTPANRTRTNIQRHSFCITTTTTTTTTTAAAATTTAQNQIVEYSELGTKYG